MITDAIKAAFECNCSGMEDELILEDTPCECDELAAHVDEFGDVVKEHTELVDGLGQIGNIYHQAETLSTESLREADVKFLNLALENEYRRIGLEGVYLEYADGAITTASMEGLFDWIGKIINGIGTAWKSFMERMAVSHNAHSNGTTHIQQRIRKLREHMQRAGKFEAGVAAIELSGRRSLHLQAGKGFAKNLSAEFERLHKLRTTLVNDVVIATADYSDKVYSALPKIAANPQTFEAELKRIAAGAPDVVKLWKKLDDGKGEYLGRTTLEVPAYKPNSHVPSWYEAFQKYVEYTPLELVLTRENARDAGKLTSIDCFNSAQITDVLDEVDNVLPAMVQLNNRMRDRWSVNYHNWSDCADRLRRALEVAGDEYSRAQITLIRIALLSGELNFVRTTNTNDFIGATYIMAADAAVAVCEQSYLNRPR